MSVVWITSRMTAMPVAGARQAQTQVGQAGISGLWQGTLAAGQRQIVIVVDLKIGDSNSGTLTLPLSDVTLPLQRVSIIGSAVHFDFQADQATFDGQLRTDGTIAGTWLQRGMTAPLTFARILSMPPRGRTQTPHAPFPYRSENVTVQNDHDHVVLAGTLTIPEGIGPFPCAVLLSVAGPDDRDQTHSGHKPFLVVADYLTRLGIAVFRTDDRGVGGSTGVLLDASYDDLASDVLTEIAFLKTRTEIRPDRIGLIGNSEGGAIGPLAATRSGDVRFVVMLAGPGIDVPAALRVQAQALGRQRGLSTEQTQGIVDRTGAVARILAAEPDNGKAEARLRDLLRGVNVTALRTYAFEPTDLDGLMKFYVSRWYRSQLAYDPAPVLARVQQPVLAITGSLDRVLPADVHLPGITRALAAGGNPDFTVMKQPGLNHLFQTALTGNVSEYSDLDESFSRSALAVIATWILNRTR